MQTKKEVIALVLAGGKGTRLKGLTSNIVKSAVDFGGKYRLIDFVLSNIANSGIDTAGIITQYEPFELTKYIGIGSAWDLDVIDGGVHVLYPYSTKNGELKWQTGTACAVNQYKSFIEMYDPEYVMVLSSDHIYKMDYSKMLKSHIASNADVTIAVKEVSVKEASRFGICVTDTESRVTLFEEKPKKPKSTLASMGNYIFSRKVLDELLEIDEKNSSSSHDFGKDVLPYALEKGYYLNAFKYDGYWRDVGTVDSYWDANMDLIDLPESLNLKDEKWPIYVSPQNLPPQYISTSSEVKNSLVDNGSIVNGIVNHSIVSSGVKIEKNSNITDSVILPNTVIEENCEIQYAVIGRDVVVPKGTKIIGKENNIKLFCIEDMDKIAKGVN